MKRFTSERQSRSTAGVQAVSRGGAESKGEGEVTKTTIRWRELLRYACGMDTPTPHIRNHYTVVPGADDDKEWSELVKAGLAKVDHEPDQHMPVRIYVVTPEGERLMKEEDIGKDDATGTSVCASHSSDAE